MQCRIYRGACTSMDRCLRCLAVERVRASTRSPCAFVSVVALTARDLRVGVILEARVEDGVGDLVTDLVCEAGQERRRTEWRHGTVASAAVRGARHSKARGARPEHRCARAHIATQLAIHTILRICTLAGAHDRLRVVLRTRSGECAAASARVSPRWCVRTRVSLVDGL
jgi:hypothetical protein